MAQKTCPDCGREITGYGRYCNFCGWDLRKRKPAAPVQPAAAPPKQESAERRERSGAAGIVITIVAALAVAAAIFFFTTGKVSLTVHEKLPGNLGGRLTNWQALAEMKSAGFNLIKSNSSSLGDTWYFEGRKVLGVQAESTTLYIFDVTEKMRIMSVTHYFREEKMGTLEVPGKTMKELLDKLTQAYGTPNRDDKNYSWRDKDIRITLSYGSGDSVVISQYY